MIEKFKCNSNKKREIIVIVEKLNLLINIGNKNTLCMLFT